MTQIANIIRVTPKDNLHIAKFMIDSKLNNGDITYPEYMQLEQLIELYKN